MVTIGIRIDFYEKPAQLPGQVSEGLLGTVAKHDCYRAQAVPRVGESVSVTALLVGPRGVDKQPLGYDGGYPFLRVREVEHYPRPVGDTEAEAGVLVVLHSFLGYEGERLESFVANYVRDGWSWLTGQYPELTAAWTKATSETA